MMVAAEKWGKIETKPGVRRMVPPVFCEWCGDWGGGAYFFSSGKMGDQERSAVERDWMKTEVCVLGVG